MKYCRSCGKIIESDMVFCPHCGSHQYSANVQKTTENTATIKGSALGFVLTFFLGIIGLILCLVLGDNECRNTSIKTLIAVVVIVVLCIFLFI